MTRLLLGLAAVSSLASGCGRSDQSDRSAPSYELVVGGAAMTFPAHHDPQLVQNDILSQLKPLWDDLQSGESATFHCTRRMPLRLGADGEERARRKFGQNVKLTSAVTITTPSFRFFKNKRGANGMEQLDPDREVLPLISGAGIEWKLVESYLRDQTFSARKIRDLLQSDWGDPAKAADGN